MALRARQHIGTIAWNPLVYGRSVLGAPLEVWPAADQCRVLLFAAIHGEEADTTFLLSRAFRKLAEPSPQCAVVLAMNPDGVMRGTRGNARGVELNRNFPASNWQPGPVCHRETLDAPRDVALSPGPRPGSEPETQALLALIEELQPHTVIAMHSNLDCIEDPARTDLGLWLSARTGLELVPDVGYPTPGSFGTWGAEHGLRVLTLELPDISGEQSVTRFAPTFTELLQRTDL